MDVSDIKKIMRRQIDIKETCEDIIGYVDYLKESIDDLQKENADLKKGIWEKEEIRRLKEDYEKMEKDYYRGFPISSEEQEKINKFKEKYKGQYYGAIGGAFTYKFIPTSVGVVGVIVGPDGKELEFQKL